MKTKKRFIVIFVSLIVLISFSIEPVFARLKFSLQEKDEVILIRDNFGVPHVYAKNLYGLYYGYGYALATDRLFQMEMTRRTVLGKVSEVLGSAYINFDKGIRSNYSPDSIQAQLDALPRKYKDIFEGYADGMNARIKEVLANPNTLLPKQFIDYGFLPTFWTPFDVVMIFVGTMCNRFGDFNTELDNLAFLEYLQGAYGEETAWKIFNQTKWVNDPGAPTTIMADDPVMVKKSIQPKLAKPSFIKSRNIFVMQRLEEERLQERKLLEKIGLEILADPPLASNLWMINKKKTDDGMGSIILNGPQFGWYVPGYVYEIGLHAPGIDIIGNTPFGYPVILFGHNKHIAWGSTAGLGDLIDIYEEVLNPANPYQYWFNGEWRDMEKRTEIISVKDGTPVTVDVYRTVHGFVIKFDMENHLAYSKRRSWEGFEIQSLIGWIESTWAENFWQWRKAASKMALNVNWYYADRMGNIGYIYCGRYPLRKENHDWRFPVRGTGEMEWLGFLPFEKNPQVYNPKRGYIVNWNNKPSPTWNDPDMWWLVWGSADRVQVI
ncbi:MAG: penicillin acylase family protein, partial [Candidatus Bathyarchaeia archaeon]